MRKTMLIVGWIVGILVIGALLLDEGQVVTLLTREDGREYETQIWVVELDGAFYIRSNRPDSEWLRRIDLDPKVGLSWKERPHAEGARLRARRVADLVKRDRVADALARKHGFAEIVWGSLVDRGQSVVLELVPVEEPGERTSAATARGLDP